MKNNNRYGMTQQAWLIGLISAAFSTGSWAAAGKIEFAVGNVIALNTSGNSRALSKGNEIDAGDTIQTKDGRVQLRFSDGGYISLQPNTEFKVEDYSFSGKADGSEKSFFNLVKGGLRAITGAIGHGANKSAYRVNTPVATIGIRGTEYLAQFDNKLLVKVGDGAVFLQNGGGDLTLFKGQSGEVGADGGKPQHSDDTPSVGAAGPTGGKPAQTQQEQQQNQQNLNTFVVGDIKTETGAPCLSGTSSGTCDTPAFDMAGEIDAIHNSLSSYGSYGGSSTSGGLTATVSYNIDFANYTTLLDTFRLESGPSDYIVVTGSGSGSLNSSNGSFDLSLAGAGGSTSGACSSGQCAISGLTGQLNPISGLPSAVINFTGKFNNANVSGAITTPGSYGPPPNF